MDMLILGVFVAAIVAMWIAGFTAFVSAARVSDYVWRAAKRSKGGTLLGIALTFGFGGLHYWQSIRPALERSKCRVPPPPKRDPWSDDGW